MSGDSSHDPLHDVTTIRARRPPTKRTFREALARENLAEMFWIIPSLFVAGAILAAYLSARLDQSVSANTWWTGTGSAASSMLTTVTGAMLTFLGVVFSVALVALQLASQQFSPRVTRIFVRSTTTRIAMGVFMATFVYCLLSMNNDDRTALDGSRPVTVTIALLLVGMSLVAFMVFVNSITRLVRVSHLVGAVADATRDSLERYYPPSAAYVSAAVPELDRLAAEVDVPKVGRHGWRMARGVLVLLDLHRLVELARAHDCVIRITARVGENLIGGQLLAEIYGRDAPSPRQVRTAAWFERERSVHQDPFYGIRELLDIGCQALSRAVNAPTTAVVVIDRLTDLLMRIGERPDPTGMFVDDDNVVRLIVPTMGWPEVVDFAFTEMRVYGERSPQTGRRLMASIDRLLATLPAERSAPLIRHRDLLRAAVEASYPDDEERRLALHPDPLGLG